MSCACCKFSILTIYHSRKLNHTKSFLLVDDSKFQINSAQWSKLYNLMYSLDWNLLTGVHFHLVLVFVRENDSFSFACVINLPQNCRRSAVSSSLQNGIFLAFEFAKLCLIQSRFRPKFGSRHSLPKEPNLMKLRLSVTN